MKEILVVAPLEDIQMKAKLVIEQNGYHNVAVKLGNLEEGVQAALEGIREGASVIVSRGGTYRLIKARVDVPVVEIRVSAYDIVESITGLPEEEPIGVVGFSNVVDGFDILQKILPMHVEKIAVKHAEDVKFILPRYKEGGIYTYVGDGTLNTVIQEQGCRAVLITSREESIAVAIREARRVARVGWREKQAAQRITTVIDSVRDGLIAIDETGKIILFNQAAEQMFQVEKAAAVGTDIQKALSFCRLPDLLRSLRPQYGKLLTVGQDKLVIDRVPVIVDGKMAGAVASFQRVSEIQNVEQKVRRKLAEKGLYARYTFEDIIHQSQAVDRCIETAGKYARYDTPTLILGESGVGKELFCQGIHNASPRKNGPFVAINCAAIPPSLMESELFGYAEGSFTGAVRRGKPGIFELAHQGTVFLDEISEIPLELQGKLLRVLQEKQVMRLGDDKILPVNVKILCASNQNLKEMVKKGEFRRDLYFRISILVLSIPALRERREDILPLAEYFVEKYSRRYELQPLEFPLPIREMLHRKSYEGNIRELEGLMERCVVLSSFDSLVAEDRGEGRTQLEVSSMATMATAAAIVPPHLDLESAMGVYIRQIFEHTGENTGETCRILKISRSTLWRKRKELEF